jgi:hypothetical protein
MPTDPMPAPCDKCRFSPSMYPGRGVVGVDAIGREPDSIYTWRGTCARGYEVLVSWSFDLDETGGIDHQRAIHLYRSPAMICSDWEEPYLGPRRSRYSRKPVI